jgi:hypothetical protein
MEFAFYVDYRRVHFHEVLPGHIEYEQLYQHQLKKGLTIKQHFVHPYTLQINFVVGGCC